nr:immunoglobulin light chain junction region [Macaca mulatta]
DYYCQVYDGGDILF